MRARIILQADAGVGVHETARELGLGRATGQRRRKRWRASAGQPFAERLCDAPRPGTAPTFAPEQICQIIALVCEPPREGGRPFTHRSQATLATAAREEGIVACILRHAIGRFLREIKLKPHRTYGWINTPRDADVTATCGDVCQTYQLAPERAAAGIETRSIDEMTGVQALERAAPTQPMRPGRPERTEFEYIRHGTTTLFADFDVATGAVGYHLGQTRTEEDFAHYLARRPRSSASVPRRRNCPSASTSAAWPITAPSRPSTTKAKISSTSSPPRSGMPAASSSIGSPRATPKTATGWTSSTPSSTHTITHKSDSFAKSAGYESTCLGPAWPPSSVDQALPPPGGQGQLRCG